MKTTLSLLLVLFIGSTALKGQTSGNPVVDVILTGYSVRAFTSVPVTDQQIDLILKCGIKAPSARNTQLWKFTVVKNIDLINEIAPNITPGNIFIVVSGSETAPEGVNVDFDCALAIENMFVAVQGLGLGGHIYGSPAPKINSSMKQKLDIPEGYRAIAVLRVGNVDKTVDAVSAATPRKTIEEIVNYKK